MVSTTTRVPGSSAVIRPVAAVPSRRGIRRSISTTSGRRRERGGDRRLAVRDRADHLDVAGVRQQRDDPGADDRMVVGHEHADHGTTASDRDRDADGEACAARRAVREAERAADEREPVAHPGHAESALGCVLQPDPVVGDGELDLPVALRDPERHPMRAGVLAHVREGLLRAAQQHDLERPGHVGLHGGLDDDAGLAGEALGERRDRGGETALERHGRSGGDERAGLGERLPRGLLEHDEALLVGMRASGRARRAGRCR